MREIIQSSTKAMHHVNLVLPNKWRRAYAYVEYLTDLLQNDIPINNQQPTVSFYDFKIYFLNLCISHFIKYKI